jgi:hypothetical protein
MRTVCHHLLVYVCGALLVAPFGWCCILPAALQAAQAKSAEEAPRCPHCPAPEAPADENEAPAPAEPMQCPCVERQAPAPTAADEYHPDLFTLSAPVVLDLPALQADDRPPTFGQFDPSQTRHVLHCVWLC